MMVGRDVRSFMVACGLPVDLPLNTDDRDIVAKFLVRFDEAGQDLEEAIGYLDRTATAQTAADLIYILAGVMETFGLDTDEILSVIHRSNLSRINEDTGKPFQVDENGKVGRGPEWYDPLSEIEDIVG